MINTKAWRLLGLAAVGVVAFALVAACGGDDDTGGASGTDTPDTGSATSTATSASDSGNNTDGTATPTTGSGQDNGNGGGSDDGLAVLQQTANSFEAGTYHVVYSIESTSVTGTFTFASEPPASLLAMDGTMDGQTGNFSIINLEDATYFCNGTPGEEMCLKLAKGNTSAIPFQLPTALNADSVLGNVLDQPGVSANKTGSKTIAGITADCYDVTSTAGDSGSFCVGNNVILSMESDVDGEHYKMEATEVETDPAKIDISVPDYPVTDMTSLGN